MGHQIKIFLIAAARPNFMKIAPLYHQLIKQRWANAKIIHTGQHYDINMSDSFFKDLNLPTPYRNLEVGSGSHAEQTGRVMIEFEKLLVSEPPDLVIVVGDVNSTMACTIAAVKLGIRVAHLEAGLRSFDREMPEEINRIVTDSLADFLWTPSEDGNQNLLREGIKEEKIELVGNIMIDSLEMVRTQIESEDVAKKLKLESGNYAVVTLHRPSNVDQKSKFKRICEFLNNLSNKIDIVFPIHPRTRKQIEAFSFHSYFNDNGIQTIDPLNYINFINLVMNAKLLITDSGGIQEETTYLGIPCLTLRENTERPVTVTQGTNTLCCIDTINTGVEQVLTNRYKAGDIPQLWDGRTANRVVKSIERYFHNTETN